MREELPAHQVERKARALMQESVPAGMALLVADAFSEFCFQKDPEFRSLVMNMGRMRLQEETEDAEERRAFEQLVHMRW